MYKMFFFDDKYLLARDNLSRSYVRPKLIKSTIYVDEDFATPYCSPFVLKKDDTYYMIYMGVARDGKKTGLVATSKDAAHFKKLDTTKIFNLEDRIAPHQIIDLPEEAEIAAIYEDNYATDNVRYKMLITLKWDNFYIPGRIMVSSDLLHWKLFKDNSTWNGGAEPLACAFYNKEDKIHTILRRRTWGDRSCGYVQTNDFLSFSKYRECLHVDSIDSPLDEIYGVSAVKDLGSMYLGVLNVYGDLKGVRHSKYDEGSIRPQLVYSYDGYSWYRSIRKPFIDQKPKESLVWLTSIVDKDDDVYFYADRSIHRHGKGFREPFGSNISTYTSKKDRYVSLKTNGNKEGRLITREYLYGGGSIYLNYKAKKISLAILEAKGGDVFSNGEVVTGYDHIDSHLPSGDYVSIELKYPKPLDELKGHIIMIEFLIEEGEIYSISGELKPLMGTEAAYHRMNK